jgi:hypothetical protein
VPQRSTAGRAIGRSIVSPSKYSEHDGRQEITVNAANGPTAPRPRISILIWHCRACGAEVTDASNWHWQAACSVCDRQQSWALEGQYADPNASPLSSAELMVQVWSALFGHCKGEDTPVATLERLAVKYAGQLFPDLAIPRMAESDLSVALTWMGTDELAQISRPHARRQPGGASFRPELLDLPVIVLELDGHKLLIDGATRINRWLASDENADHPVYHLRLESDR